MTVMLLDVLSGLKELAICVGYELDGKRIDEFPSDAFLLGRCKPVFETLPGWDADLTKARKRSDLPPQAMRYVERLSKLIDVPVSMVSVGPDRDQTIRM
jgi:adenylosuccinate synthase